MMIGVLGVAWLLLFQDQPRQGGEHQKSHIDYEKVTKPKDFTFHRKFTMKIC